MVFNPLLYLFWVLALLTLPLRWLLASVFAACFHELCHVAAVIALGGQIYGMRIHIGGAVIYASLPGRFREVLSILAGPVGSLCLLGFRRSWTEAALCGLVQGVFNLLPLPGFDGWRIWNTLFQSCR